MVVATASAPTSAAPCSVPAKGGPPTRTGTSLVVGVARRARGSWHHQALLRQAGGLLLAAVLAAGVVAAVLVWLRLAEAGGIARAFDERWITATLAVVAAIPPTAVGLVRTARSDHARRRQIGMLWDILAFWPRTTHPFAPPSYGEALVPAVTERVNALDTRVADDQGSGTEATAPLATRVPEEPDER